MESPGAFSTCRMKQGLLSSSPPGSSPRQRRSFINTHMLRSGPTERNFSSAESRAGPVTHKSLRKEFIPPPEQNTTKLNATQMLKLFGFYAWKCQDFAIILAGLLHWDLGHTGGCPEELLHPRAWTPRIHPQGMGTPSSPPLTSHSHGQHSKRGFFRQPHPRPWNQHQLELSSTGGPRASLGEQHTENSRMVWLERAQFHGNPGILSSTKNTLKAEERKGTAAGFKSPHFQPKFPNRRTPAHPCSPSSLKHIPQTP